MKHYFFYYIRQKSGGGGSQVLSYPGEFDLLQSHRWLLAQFKEVCIIQGWQEISETQATQYNKFLDLYGPSPAPKAPVLKLVPRPKPEAGSDTPQTSA